MDKFIKSLKIILLSIGILIGVGIIAGMVFAYRCVKSGDFASCITRIAVENVIDDTKLTQEQKDMLESGDYEGLAEDLGENITDEQIDCAVQAVGEERAKELMVTQDPTPQEIIKLSQCL